MKKKKQVKKREFFESKDSGEKKGLSGVVSIVVIIAIALVAIVIVFMVIFNLIQDRSEFVEIQSAAFSERFEVEPVKTLGNTITYSLKKIEGRTISTAETTTITSQSIDADIFAVADLSGSMGDCSEEYECTYTCSVEGPQNCMTVIPCKGNACKKYNDNQCGTTSDHSGSCPPGLTLVEISKQAHIELVDEILIDKNPKAKMGLIAYNTKVDNSHSNDLTDEKNTLEIKINFWEANPSGYTCICCGIKNATERFQSDSQLGKSKVMIVMSDGVANRNCAGGSLNAKQEAIDKACEANTTLENLVIYTVGFGTKADKETLKSIAECTNDGKYFDALDMDSLIEIYKQISEEISSSTSTEITVISYLKVVFYSNNDSYTVDINDPPELLQTKVYTANLEGNLEGRVRKIEVYPVVVTKSGKQVIGPLLGMWIY